VKQGAINASPSLIKLKILRLRKLSSVGPDALIGSTTSKDGTAKHNLFLVLERTETGWSVAWASYHFTRDTQDYVDDVEENLVDQVDLDASGKDEIMTIRITTSLGITPSTKTGMANGKGLHRGGGGC
jgi:hypothetical protein